MQIIETKISDLKPYEANARTHPKSQIELLKRNIIRFGFTTPCLIDQNNVIIAGHGRVIAVKEMGWETVPCVMIDTLTDDEVKALRLADNQLGLLSDWNMELVKDELIALGPDTELLDLTGFSRDLILTPEEKDDMVPDNAPPVAKLGDVWRLGQHYILCGDSTKKEDVERLLSGKKAQMCFTDPPYNVNYTGGMNEADKNTRAGIKNDNMSKEQFRQFMIDAMKPIVENVEGGGIRLYELVGIRLVETSIRNCWRTLAKFYNLGQEQFYSEPG